MKADLYSATLKKGASAPEKGDVLRQPSDLEYLGIDDRQGNGGGRETPQRSERGNLGKGMFRGHR